MPTPRRILVLNERDPRHPRAGGAEIHVAQIFSRLVEGGHSVHQYSSGFPGGAAREVLDGVGRGIQIERVRPLARYYAGVPGRLLRTRRDEPFDVVVECLNKVPFYAPLLARVPVLALCHHLFGEVAFAQVSMPIAAAVWLSERGLRPVYRDVPFLAISESTRDDLIARGIAADRIEVSHPGIERPRLAVDLESPRPCRVTYVGRLEAYKRVDVFLRAAAQLVERFPDLEIIVIGHGRERPDLETLAHRLDLADRTRFTGFLEDAERDEILAGSLACVFPSEKEGWGLTVIEANALGTPVVASDAPGLRDSVRDGVTGILARPGDPEAFADGLARLLEDTPETRAMRRAAYEWSRRFDWDRAAADMENAIESAIAKAPRR